MPVWPFTTKDPSQYQRVDEGWDVQAEPGAAIHAIASGTVGLANRDPGGFGNDYPFEDLDEGIGGLSSTVYYGHVHISVPPGTHVNAGDVIAYANVTNGENDGGASENGSAAPPGWLEIGFAQPGTGNPVQHGSGATGAGQAMHDILIGAAPGGGSHGYVQQVGDRGYDWSGATYSAAQIRFAGGKYGFRYLSGGGNPKDWTHGQLQDFLGAGLGVGAYWETGATRMLDGFGAGVDDARAAAGEAAAIGYTGAVWFADDENNPDADDQKMAYVDGVATVTQNFEVYGSGHLIDLVAQRHGRIHGGHVSSWGSTGNAGFRQEANFHTLAGTDDLTLEKADNPLMGGGAVAPVPNKELDMYELATNESPPKGYRIYPYAKVIAVRSDTTGGLASEYARVASVIGAHGEGWNPLWVVVEVIRALEAQGRPTDQASIEAAIQT